MQAPPATTAVAPKAIRQPIIACSPTFRLMSQCAGRSEQRRRELKPEVDDAGRPGHCEQAGDHGEEEQEHAEALSLLAVTWPPLGWWEVAAVWRWRVAHTATLS